jgi:hypothetical protein
LAERRTQIDDNSLGRNNRHGSCDDGLAMFTRNVIPFVRSRRAVRAGIVLFSLSSALLLGLEQITFASEPASTPAAPAVVSTPSAPATLAPGAATQGSSAAQPVGHEVGTAADSLPTAGALPMANAPPATGHAEPAAVRSAAQPEQASHDEYDGPPLLLGDSKKKVKVGGYGGLTIAYSRMLNRDGMLVGGEGAVLVDHRLSFGAAGYVFSRSPDGPPAPDGTAREYFTGYGGVLIRYAIYSDLPVYASFGALIGGGAVTLAPRVHDDSDESQHENVKTRGYFVFQPDVSLHANATRWLRFGLIFGYRVATPVNDFDFHGGDVSGVVVGGSIQAGWF